MLGPPIRSQSASAGGTAAAVPPVRADAADAADALLLRRDPDATGERRPRVLSEVRRAGAQAASYTGAVLLLASGVLALMQLRAEMGFADAGADIDTAAGYRTGGRIALVAGGICVLGALFLAPPWTGAP